MTDQPSTPLTFNVSGPKGGPITVTESDGTAHTDLDVQEAIELVRELIFNWGAHD